MGNRSCPELTLSFLLMAALCLEALIIERQFFSPRKKMTWTEARLYCQKNHTDLVTWNTGNKSWLNNWLVKIKVRQIWIGLHRDPENDSVWKWINVKTGEGISGKSVSQSSYWADGQQSSHCAVVRDGLQWHSVKCSSEHSFYCSAGDNITRHNIFLNWYNASQYCRNRGSELATITQTHQLDKGGWIGLYREAGETWSWIGDWPSNYRHWAPKEPLSKDCAFLDLVTDQWYSKLCSQRLRFACYDDNLVVVNENKTWEDALEHCQDMEPCVGSLKHCKYNSFTL